MADITPFGVSENSGRGNILRTGEFLVFQTLQLLGYTGLPGFTGIQGPTGLQNPNQGATGIGLVGFTGIIGHTGVSPRGDTGLDGLTGLMGVTGISPSGATGFLGSTGIQGVTGLIGSQGTTGLRGYTGLQGETGISDGVTGLTGVTGIAISGSTGIRGDTGLLGDTGLQGQTGVGVLGVTGFQGNTGIQGQTGMLDLLTVDVQRQLAGVTLLYTIPANTFNLSGQQLEITSWGLSATDGAVTTITVTYEGNVIFTDTVSFAGGADILIEGYILFWAAVEHFTTIKGYYEDGTGTMVYVPNILLPPGSPQNLFVSLSSAGTGHILYGIIVRRVQPGTNESI
jgi:hypothetical protein